MQQQGGGHSGNWDLGVRKVLYVRTKALTMNPGAEIANGISLQTAFLLQWSAVSTNGGGEDSANNTSVLNSFRL